MCILLIILLATRLFYIIIIIIIIIHNRNTAHVECKSKGDTANNRGDWDYFTVI